MTTDNVPTSATAEAAPGLCARHRVAYRTDGNGRLISGCWTCGVWELVRTGVATVQPKYSRRIAMANPPPCATTGCQNLVPSWCATYCRGCAIERKRVTSLAYFRRKRLEAQA